MNNMGIIKTIAKGICATVAILASFMLVMFVILTICWGPFGGGADSAASTVDAIQTATPTVTPDQVGSSIEEHIIVYKDGQDDIVECKRLSVFGNNNVIQIANEDVEKILITGHGNVISYSSSANPQIIDHGNYNDVWQRWLT
ncbi:MAG: hypothetical protein C4B59_12260 [Candidatus Methanogaster sp.]|uniref:Uncharacterized protein n=1 Tax=Candidatus Methanogaster sp. TaxID=3386292 RepID=A0AC61L0Q8_9EURY|nr:MAG: hypothetical protein C4B59_12260 [ANME-2 cluster archaeon]